MKAKCLLVRWHDQLPIFSVDFEKAFPPPPTAPSATAAAAAASASPAAPASSDAAAAPFCPSRLATAGGDKNVRLWRLSYAGPTPAVDYLATLARHNGAVNCVRWSPVAPVLASASDDGQIILWTQNVGAVAGNLEAAAAGTGPLSASTSASSSAAAAAAASTGWGAAPAYAGSGIPAGGPDAAGPLGVRASDAAGMSDSGGGGAATPGAEDDLPDAEYWSPSRLLRGPSGGDVYDMAWSPCGGYLASACIDRSVRVWETRRGTCVRTIPNHDHYVQGVAWDPMNRVIASMAADRTLRLYSVAGVLNETIPPNRFRPFAIIEKMTLTAPAITTSASDDTAMLDAQNGAPAVPLIPVVAPATKRTWRLWPGEETGSFFRRLAFSPDGKLLFVPTGLWRPAAAATASSAAAALAPAATTTTAPTDAAAAVTASATNETDTESRCVYVFATGGLQQPSPTPLLCIAGFKEHPLIVAVNPRAYRLRLPRSSSSPPDTPPPRLLDLPGYRFVFAVLTQDSVRFYDTQQRQPLAVLEGLHYARYTDAAWTPRGDALVMASLDGYCSVMAVHTPAPGEAGAGDTDEWGEAVTLQVRYSPARPEPEPTAASSTPAPPPSTAPAAATPAPTPAADAAAAPKKRRIAPVLVRP